jgi:hypothetical protein
MHWAVWSTVPSPVREGPAIDRMKRLGAPGAGNSDSEPQDAPGRLLTCL